jgi:hypothetical protein
MSSETASFVMPLSAVFIYFVIVSLNIYIAKRKIVEWKKYSTIFFLMGIATVRIKHSASLWMDRFGYNYEDASLLATFQLFAGLESFLAAFTALAIEVNTVVH